MRASARRCRSSLPVEMHATRQNVSVGHSKSQCEALSTRTIVASGSVSSAGSMLRHALQICGFATSAATGARTRAAALRAWPPAFVGSSSRRRALRPGRARPQSSRRGRRPTRRHRRPLSMPSLRRSATRSAPLSAWRPLTRRDAQRSTVTAVKPTACDRVGPSRHELAAAQEAVRDQHDRAGALASRPDGCGSASRSRAPMAASR